MSHHLCDTSTQTSHKCLKGNMRKIRQRSGSFPPVTPSVAPHKSQAPEADLVRAHLGRCSTSLSSFKRLSSALQQLAAPAMLFPLLHVSFLPVQLSFKALSLPEPILTPVQVGSSCFFCVSLLFLSSTALTATRNYFYFFAATTPTF